MWQRRITSPLKRINQCSYNSMWLRTLRRGDDDCGGNGCGSFLLTVPPMQQRKQQYYVVFNTANSASGKHNVNLIVATSLRNGLLINGTDLSNYINSSNIILHPPSAPGAAPPTWNIIDQNQNSTNNNESKNSLSSIQFPVNGGLHRISHNSSSNALFTVTSVPHSNDAQKLQLPETVALNQSFAAAKEKQQQHCTYSTSWKSKNQRWNKQCFLIWSTK